MQFRAVKGMNDLLPGELGRWQRLEAAFRQQADLHGYGELRTPLLEATQLFARSIGESTDVVQKEMYTFERGKESLTLRPEGTASAVRAYIEHKIYAREPVTRWYYLGPMYRAERPQRGRYRQFYQAGVEVFGDPGPVCDAELITFLVRLFERLGIRDLQVAINSLGTPQTRARYVDALRAYLQPKRAQLSELSQSRLDANALRVLDSKAPEDHEATQDAPTLLEFLEPADQAHFTKLQEHLTTLGVAFLVEPRLVRGLDYYTRTLFEIRSEQGDLGSQNTLVGGGRYDGLVQLLGGPDTPGIGFAMGLERLLLAMDDVELPSPPSCFIAPLGDRATSRALVLAQQLREHHIRVELEGRGGSLKSLLRRANSSGARYALVLGDSEIEAGVVQLKDLRDATAPKLETIAEEQIVDVLQQRIAAARGPRE